RDFNLNAERWAAIVSHFTRAGWSKQVSAARRTAEKLLRGSKEWAERIAERLSAAKREAAEREAQVASRLAFLSGKHRAEERERSKVEAAVSAALIAGIQKPDVRLDSVAAIFLANWNPFTETDE
ncbi:MAG: hypothetical protein J0I06_11930, partial [Planctomycetes bacterium]|nr:hypothetical protein [Planctomycetota bacterium]